MRASYDTITSLSVCMRNFARLYEWLWECGMRDCAYRYGSVECAIVCVGVGVRSARMHALMTEYSFIRMREEEYFSVRVPKCLRVY